MAIWRPHPQIRVKAVGLLWKDCRILAAEVRNDTGDLKGVRPLGGSVEFGETWQNALKREFLEELQLDIQIEGPPLVLENIYHHEGHQGHEVIFVADVSALSHQMPPDGPIMFKEDNGLTCIARWFDPNELDSDGPELFPTGLKQYLTNR